MAGGIVLPGFLVRVIYPHYLPSVGTARIILVAVLASWLMPVSQSASARPWIDGAVIFPSATILLGIAMVGLYRMSADEGVAWASTVSALSLVLVQVVALHHTKILCARDGLLAWSLTA